MVFASTILGGYLALAGVIIGLGFLLVDVLTPVHAIGQSDEAVNVWLAQHRSGSLNDASFVGSSIGDVPVLPVLVAIVVAGAAALRHWRVVGFILGSILLEVATYRVASLIVHRQRPGVVRLDHLPANQSFPSGHVAASVAVYGALALLATSRWRRRSVSIAAWTAAILLPILVASSRMYRGMHHPLDVTSGAIVGVLSLVVALWATRAADATQNPRNQGRALT
jgi:undecaprenyl-diphosphatase